MSIIKQIKDYDNGSWQLKDIGANAENIDLNSSIFSETNIKTALENLKSNSTTINSSLGNTDISDIGNGTVTGAINYLNTTDAIIGNTDISSIGDGTITNAIFSLNNNTYTKNEVYTKSEVEQLIASASSVKIVDQLPSVGEQGIIYWILNDTGFDVYIYENNNWKNEGSVSINLDDYQKILTAGTSLSIDSATNIISHINSGVVAGTKGTNNATALTPAFGGTFYVPGFDVNATGHITSANAHTVKIPNTTASTSTNGLMTTAQVTKLNGIATGATKNSLSVQTVNFYNPSALSFASHSDALIECTSGTAPSGYTFIGISGFNTTNINIAASNVGSSFIRGINWHSGTINIAAKTAYVQRVYMKIT